MDSVNILWPMAKAAKTCDRLRRPLSEGEPIIIIEPQGKKHYLNLRSGDKFHHTRLGYLTHDAIIGCQPGALLLSDRGLHAVCLRLTFEDFVLKELKRRTSIIHPKDLATLLVRGDLFPGARVLEAGAGSGATCVTLLRYLGPEGQLISYERRQEFIALTLENVAKAQELYGDPGAKHQIQLRDIYEDGIEEKDLDTVLLDLPEPHRATKHALKALRPGGTLLCWLPTVTQVYLLVRQLQQEPLWAVVETRETLERSWQVGKNAMRPYHRMVGHTGFWIRTRRLERPEE
jgi:tRNA (adenine57-N1/adenine58-N1)-methyltransferase